MENTTTKILYTVKEVAKIMHTNHAFVYSLINAGLLPALRLGSYKIRYETLMKFLEEHEGEDLRDPKNIRPVCKTDSDEHHEPGEIYYSPEGHMMISKYR